jgi:hypothetical protein
MQCDLMKQRDLIISNEDLLNVHSFLALLHFFVSFVSLGVDGNLMVRHFEAHHSAFGRDVNLNITQDISESCTLSNLFDKHVFYWLKRTWELFDQNKVCKLCMLLVHISFTETFEKGCARVALRVCSCQGNACFHGENNCAGFTSGQICLPGARRNSFIKYDILWRISVQQALTADVLWAEGHDGYLHFCNSLVKRYDSKCLPMIYLADCIEVRPNTDPLFAHLPARAF